jgi:hypothetical protein
MCCVYDGLEPYNHYEPQQDTNNPNPVSTKYSLTNKRVHTHTIVETLQLHLYLNYETN